MDQGGSSSRRGNPEERPLVVHNEDIQLGHREVLHIGCHQISLVTEGVFQHLCDEGDPRPGWEPVLDPWNGRRIIVLKHA